MFKWLTGGQREPSDPLRVIGPNLRLELEVAEGDYRGEYVSRVEETSGDRLLISAPDDRGVTVPLREGTAVTVIFSDAYGSYSYTTRIQERIRQPVAAFAIELPARGRLQRLFRRDFPRYDVHLPLVFQVVDSPEIYYPDRRNRTETINLSAGGVGFLWRERVAPGSRLRLELELPDEEPPLAVAGEVLKATPAGRAGGHRMGVHFGDLDAPERGRIMDFIHSIRRTATGSARD